MKRILVVLVIIILALLILTAVLWKAFQHVGPSGTTTVTLPQGGQAVSISSTISNTEQSPSKFASGFYQLYITGSSETEPANITNWLTPAFASNLNALTQELDTDPILLSQDFPPEWAEAKNISATTLSQSAADAWIQLTFSPSLDPTTNVLHSIKVHLLYTKGEWRIDSVTTAN